MLQILLDLVFWLLRNCCIQIGNKPQVIATTDAEQSKTRSVQLWSILLSSLSHPVKSQSEYVLDSLSSIFLTVFLQESPLSNILYLPVVVHPFLNPVKISTFMLRPKIRPYTLRRPRIIKHKYRRHIRKTH
jgi:hypothetical protein